MVKRSRHRPLTPVTRVRFPHGSPLNEAGSFPVSDIFAFAVHSRRHLTGAYDDEVPPVPIPNTVVKLIRAEDTWRVTAWENRSVPVLKIWMILSWNHPYIYSSIAQLAEHAAVNRRVVGSSPTWGAISERAAVKTVAFSFICGDEKLGKSGFFSITDLAGRNKR